MSAKRPYSPCDADDVKHEEDEKSGFKTCKVDADSESDERSSHSSSPPSSAPWSDDEDKMEGIIPSDLSLKVRRAIKYPPLSALSIDTDAPMQQGYYDWQEAWNRFTMREANTLFDDNQIWDYLYHHVEILEQRFGRTEAVVEEEQYWSRVRMRTQLCECTAVVKKESNKYECSCQFKGTYLRGECEFQAGVHNDLCTPVKHATAMRTRCDRIHLIFKCSLDIGEVNSLALDEDKLRKKVETTPLNPYTMLYP